MRIAITTWQGRVSPVFDVSGEALILDVENGSVVARERIALEGASVLDRVRALSDRGVSTLICGALSRASAACLESRGIEALGFVAGEVEAVLGAWLQGSLGNPEWRMPGCCGRGPGRGRRRRQQRGGRCRFD